MSANSESGSSDGNRAAHNGPTPAPAGPRKHDPYSALRLPEYRRFLLGHVISIVGMQMQTAATFWEVKRRTDDNFMLGLVGLVQFLPMIVLAIPAGQLLDRFDRRKIIIVALCIVAASSAALAAIAATDGPVWSMYACLFFTGVARVLQQPAKASFLPTLIPREAFSNAVTWNMSGFQLAAVGGPALAGLLIYLMNLAQHPLGLRGPEIVFAFDAFAALLFVGLLMSIRSPQRTAPNKAVTFESLLAGLRFVFENKIILALMALDMFAVLLGGAVALLPTYAKDILKVGPGGYGLLQAAPAAGAVLMAATLAHLPPFRRSGRALLWAVAGFGAATIAFGLSRSFPLSLAMLFLTGAFDNISVVVRHTLVQLQTPDEMRGRVSAVNTMFIGTSNELGGFESGTVAKIFERPGDPMFGPTVSVVAGGLGTLLVVAAIGLSAKQLRRVGRLDGNDDEQPQRPLTT